MIIILRASICSGGPSVSRLILPGSEGSVVITFDSLFSLSLYIASFFGDEIGTFVLIVHKVSTDGTDLLFHLVVNFLQELIAISAFVFVQVWQDIRSFDISLHPNACIDVFIFLADLDFCLFASIALKMGLPLRARVHANSLIWFSFLDFACAYINLLEIFCQIVDIFWHATYFVDVHLRL